MLTPLARRRRRRLRPPRERRSRSSCQGHPEYDADTLAREYLRDVGRFLKGQRPQHPRPPTGYFDAETESALSALAGISRAAPKLERLPRYAAAIRAAPRQTWRASAVNLYRNWLAELGARAAAPAAARSFPAA